MAAGGVARSVGEDRPTGATGTTRGAVAASATDAAGDGDRRGSALDRHAAAGPAGPTHTGSAGTAGAAIAAAGGSRSVRDDHPTGPPGTTGGAVPADATGAACHGGRRGTILELHAAADAADPTHGAVPDATVAAMAADRDARSVRDDHPTGPTDTAGAALAARATRAAGHGRRRGTMREF